MREVDNKIPPIPIPQTLNLTLEATKLCTEPFAVNRYHAMRPLASEYSSPSLTMMLEIGLRTAEANRLWSIFNNIAQTSVWLAVGAAVAEKRSGQQIRAGYRQLVLGAQIGNSSNHCYANSLVKCVLWLCEDTTELQAMLGQLLFDGVRPALTGSPHCLWRNDSWQEAMTGWAMPHSQHDVGEFLRYFVQQSGGLKYALELSWEARLFNGADDDAVRTDVTNSEVLVIDPYLADATHRGDSVMLQHLIHAWENQAYIHALTERPLILAILIGRFSNEGGRIRKYHGKIIPNEFLEIPVFDINSFHAKRYELNSFVAHSGSTPFAGHYTAVFRHGSMCLKADDGLVAQPLDDVQFQQMCSQGHLFFYQSV